MNLSSGTCEKESVTLNIPVTGIPEGKGAENGIEKVFNETVSKISPS